MDLPIIKGETDKSCGVASLKSVFEFYGKKYSEIEISEHNKIREGTNWIYDLGYSAIKLGFDVEIIDYNYFLYSTFDITDVKEYLLKNKYMYSAKHASDSALNYLREGGEIKIKIPSIKDIKNYIDKGIPVIARVRPKIYMGKHSANSLHYIVIEDYDENKFRIMDPLGFKKEITEDILLYSMYSSFAQILIIKN